MSNKKVQRSAEQRYAFHFSRQCGYGGLPFNNGKAQYSSGFVDALHNIDNSNATTREFGKRAGNAYRLGHSNGTNARKQLFIEDRSKAVRILNNSYQFEDEWKKKGWLFNKKR